MQKGEPVDNECDAPAGGKATKREAPRRVAANLPLAAMYQPLLTEEVPASMLALIEQLQ